MGLGGYWADVMDVLRDIIPIYDKVNSYISLGKDMEHRKLGISGRVYAGDKVLDAGCGPGNMSSMAMSICGSLDVVLYDPLIPMLMSAGDGTKRVLSCGVFEHMPFRDGQFDVVMCGYSLRDAINLRIAISEMHRILKDGGRLVIVDLGKPDNMLFRIGASFYLRMILPVIACVVGGRKGLKFATLYGTFKRWPQNAKLECMLGERFGRIEFETRLAGGAVIIAAYKV